MAISNRSVSPNSSEQSGTHLANSNTNQVQAPSNQRSRSSSRRRTGIFWDIENCHVPTDVCVEDVAINIIMALRSQNVIKGVVPIFSAYGDFGLFTKKVRAGLQRTGVKLIDVPNGKKDAADKAILVDMFVFALDYPPPSFIVLISRDVDFAQALHILSQRGYTVIVVVPSRKDVSKALCNAGKFVLEWPNVARGGPNDIVASLMEFRIPNNANGQNEEVLAGPASSGDQNDSTLCVQPRDLNDLKGQLVTLLKLSGGDLPLNRVSVEYQKKFGRLLCVSDYGVDKLVQLFAKMSDSMVVAGQGNKKLVYLRSVDASPSASKF